MHKLSNICLAILAICTTACGESEVRNVTVEHYTVPCVGADYQTCMIIIQDESPLFRYSGISGFDPMPGHRYEVEVVINDVANPPQDGSSTEWSLGSVLSDTPVPLDTEFIWTLPAGGELLTVQSDGLSVDFTLDQAPLRCVSADVCDALGNLDSTTRANLTLTYGEDYSDRVIQAVTPM